MELIVTASCAVAGPCQDTVATPDLGWVEAAALVLAAIVIVVILVLVRRWMRG